MTLATIFHLANSHESYFIGEKHFGEAPKFKEVVTVEVESEATDEATAEAVWLAFEAGAPGERHPAKEANRIRSFMVGDVIGFDIVNSSVSRFFRVAGCGFTPLTTVEVHRVISSAVADAFAQIAAR